MKAFNILIGLMFIILFYFLYDFFLTLKNSTLNEKSTISPSEIRTNEKWLQKDWDSIVMFMNDNQAVAKRDKTYQWDYYKQIFSSPNYDAERYNKLQNHLSNELGWQDITTFVYENKESLSFEFTEDMRFYKKLKFFCKNKATITLFLDANLNEHFKNREVKTYFQMSYDHNSPCYYIER